MALSMPFGDRPPSAEAARVAMTIKTVLTKIGGAVAFLAGLAHAELAAGKELASADNQSAIIFPPGMDDSSCTWKWLVMECIPSEFCAYDFKFGDLGLDSSCRLVTSSIGQLPQQPHLAFAGDKAGSGMTMSWTTYMLVNDSAVWIGQTNDSLTQVTDADIEIAQYFKEDDYTLFTYHATVTGLKPHTKYFYRVGSIERPHFQSGIGSFTTARAPGDGNDEDGFEFLVYGDFGVDDNAVSTAKYINDLDPDNIDFIYHIGDISYADNAFLQLSEALGFFYEETYNRWMNSMTPVMKQIPYMVAVGNHEAECHSPACAASRDKQQQLGNYTAYNARFRMPSNESNGTLNMWYSFDHGTVHFTTISSETDYEDAPSNAYVQNKPYGGFGDQMSWLEADLKKADANRDVVPWIVVGMHRPAYTLNKSDKDGNPQDEALPVQKAFEELFIKYNVDVVFTGHEHAYERQYPIAHSTPVMDGVSEDAKTYVSPKAPVYVLSGAAGQSEGLRKYDNTKAPWNAAFNNDDYGISSVHVSRNRMAFKFIATESGDVLDEFEILKKPAATVKDKHQTEEKRLTHVRIHVGHHHG